VTINFGPNDTKAEFDVHDITIKIYSKGQLQLVVNERNFFNIEHYRKQDENEKHLLPFESDFDLFKDSHNTASVDSVPLGPESIGLDFTFAGYKHVYGIPEHADSMSLKDTSDSNWPYRLFNVDIFEYETDSRMPMYGSIPLMLATKPEMSAAVFWLNAADTFIDIHKSNDVKTHWISENGVMDFIVILGETPAEINAKYGRLTGYAPLPPLFSLGYHQCRWNYNDEKDVLDITAKMDETLVPYDTIWLDVEYTDAKKYFTWDEDAFPDPERMLKALDRTGRNVVIIIDPHLKVGYYVSDEVRKRDLAMKNAKNETFHGHCWPGESVWIDTFNPSSREYWDSLFVRSETNKVMGGMATNIYVWNDMNEPSVFDGPETSAPRDNIFYDGWEHRSVHNVNGMTFHEATFESLTKRLELSTRQRPFILTRAFYAGSQRTAAMWTGDNMAKWEYLEASIPMVLSSGIAGMPFAGADVGGFFGNPSKELLTRWYQAGIWYPFFRAHAHIDSRRREPWVPGEPYTSIIRDAIRLRYALLPTWYTCFYDLSQTGLPVTKPIFYECPHNLQAYEIDDQFFLGDSGLMVKPVTGEGATNVDVYLPDNEVYYGYTNGVAGKPYKGPKNVELDVELADIPMFLKGGSIIARKDRYRRSTKLMQNDPYTLVVAFDNQGKASGKLHIDDGESYGYKEGQEINLQFHADSYGIAAEVEPGSDTGYLEAMHKIKIEKIILLGHGSHDQALVTQGEKLWQLEIVDGEIRNVAVSVAAEWKIKLATKLTHDEL
jgi:alpha 1,3-glucosidase